MKIVITGAKGFLGRRLVRAALEAGHEVVGIDRPGTPALNPPTGSEMYTDCSLDLLDLKSESHPAFEGADAVIHCAALITGPDEEVIRVNVDGTAALLDAMESETDARFVFMSSMAVFEAEPGAYGRSKKEAEEAVRTRRPTACVLRPTMIYGKDDPGWTTRIRERVSKKRILFLPGGGRAKIQPLHVADAVGIILSAALRKEAAGAAFDLAGPEAITQRDFLRRARDRLDGTTMFCPLPLWPFHLAGALLGGRFKAMAAFGSEDHLVDIRPAHKALGFDPCPPDEGLDATFP